ncbi:hypothetical protein Tco_0216389 [Tanacetum coccineum]
MSNSKESVNEGEMGEISKKLKRKFETMKWYEDDERSPNVVSKNTSKVMLLTHGSPPWNKGEKEMKDQEAHESGKIEITEAKSYSLWGSRKAT